MASDEFLIDEHFKPPEPFERAVASLDLRCISNAMDNGLDLQVTAKFGADFVRINLDDGGVIEVNCKIIQAMIVAKPYNCHFTDLEVSHNAGFSYEQSFEGERSHSGTLSKVAGLSVDGKANSTMLGSSAHLSASSDSKDATQDTYCISGQRSFQQVEFNQDEIRIHPNPDNSPLIGNLVDRATCFRILPIDESKPFGVMLKLQVRRNWMTLSDPESIKISDRLRGLISKAFNGTDPIDKFHKEAFNLLMSHLVAEGLQSNSNDIYATLAARTIRAEKISEDRSEHRHIELFPRSFTLPVHDMDVVLSNDPEQVRQTLLSNGVDAKFIPKLPRDFIFTSGRYGYRKREQESLEGYYDLDKFIVSKIHEELPGSFVAVKRRYENNCLIGDFDTIFVSSRDYVIARLMRLSSRARAQDKQPEKLVVTIFFYMDGFSLWVEPGVFFPTKKIEGQFLEIPNRQHDLGI